LTSDGKLTGIDYSHCKGCGICAEECPVKAIKMVDEKEFIRQKGGKNE
jgi:pyruvate ferredoxin oxidoreductase delta subunit